MESEKIKETKETVEKVEAVAPKAEVAEKIETTLDKPEVVEKKVETVEKKEFPPRREGGFHREGGYQRDGNRNRDNRDSSDISSDKKKFYYTKKVCKFCTKQIEEKNLDYKNVDLLRRFVMPSGKILPRRISGNCAKHQRRVVVEVKKARILALLPIMDR